MPFVSVAVRVKPVAVEEGIAVWPKPTVGKESCRRVCCHRGCLLEEYEFSRVFGPADDNRSLFEGVQGPAITDSVFSGVSETLFAYGQTGSGKSHTIFGTGNEPGLLQYFVRAVFEQAAESLGSTVHVCCYEVMGDTLTDLINPDALVQRGTLRQEDVVSDELFLKTQKFRYKIVQVDSKATCMTLLQEARVNRTSGTSSCNSSSSRSHAIVHIFVQNPALAAACDGGITSSSIGALTLVDLAGAEREHDNPSEQGRKSARVLNTSLSSLNRLLRKLQTNSLDESERRQSVLNKCLWEYLRPGCGIALIFCVNPLFRHRATSLSTLSMATASKLIHSRRKSQYIQVPGGAMQVDCGVQSQALAANAASPRATSPRSRLPASSPGPRALETTPRASKASTDHTARLRGRTPDAMSTPRQISTPAKASGAPRVSTPRRTSTSTPAGARGSNGVAGPQSRRSFTGSTPTASFALYSPFCLPPSSLEEGLPQAETQYDRERESTQLAETTRLELQNSKLRQKLSRTRTRSRDRLVSVEQAHNQLSNENAVLRQECESLRSLFIRQQQQQIAFWAGPFMEMILPKSGPQSGADELASAKLDPTVAALAAASPTVAGVTGGAAEAAGFGEAQDILKAPKLQSQSRFLGIGDALTKSCLDVAGLTKDIPDMEARSECVQSLLKDRDYWQQMASHFQGAAAPQSSPLREIGNMHRGAPLVHLSLEKGTVDTRSTSQQSSQCSAESECGGNAEAAWSDSGTESTMSAAEAWPVGSRA